MPWLRPAVSIGLASTLASFAITALSPSVVPAAAVTLAETSGAAARITLSPAAATIVAGESQTYQAEAYDQAGNDLGDVTSATTFSLDNNPCGGNVCGTPLAGSYQVIGIYQQAFGTANLTVQGGPLYRITLSPANAIIFAGDSQTYVVHGFDSIGNDLGDLTASASFSISPDGTCAAGTCSATLVGDHMVVAIIDNNHPASVMLRVKPGPLDHLILSPASATIVAGGSQGYSVEGFDSYNNDIGNFSNFSTFAITPDGSCAYGCSATTAGLHTVTATAYGKSATGDLTVTPGPLSTLTISPSSATLTVGGMQTFTAAGVDAYGNAVALTSASWSVAPGTPGSISSVTGVMTTLIASSTTTGSGAVQATLNGVTAQATVAVTPSAPTNLVASANHKTVVLTWNAAAGARTYTVYRGTSSINLTLVKAGVSSRGYTDKSVASGVTYYYYVVAVGANGLQSLPSNPASATAN